jgi:cytidine deaminase
MNTLTQPDLALLAFARQAQEMAYAPYSCFRVGAAIYTDGDVVQGCNVENSAYGTTLCAERSAAAQAVLKGYKDFDAIAIVGDSEDPLVPCGNCLQFLSEFNPSMRIIMGARGDVVRVASLDELLPEAFARGYLDQEKDVDKDCED